MSLLHQLTFLNHGNTAYSKAPHKPILLLAVIDGRKSGFSLVNGFHPLLLQVVLSGLQGAKPRTV